MAWASTPSLLADNETKVRELNSGVIEQAFVVANFDAELGKSRAKLYQITATAGNESDAKKVTTVINAAMDEFTKFGETFAPVKTALLPAGTCQRIASRRWRNPSPPISRPRRTS